MNGHERIGLLWIVVAGFVRLMTHPRIMAQPATPANALDYVVEWNGFRNVTPLSLGMEHLGHLRRALIAAGVGANLVTDAHLAAPAMEWQAELHSNDTDFSRYPGLRWRNPL